MLKNSIVRLKDLVREKALRSVGEERAQCFGIWDQTFQLKFSLDTFGESLVLPSETSGVAAENDSGNEAQAEQNEELEVSKKHSSSM
uniref:Uncharacterized protein n=1 Tax=Salix viminalis TaxID=40686 RepID=A0A6N2L458_SALVM